MWTFALPAAQGTRTAPSAQTPVAIAVHVHRRNLWQLCGVLPTHGHTTDCKAQPLPNVAAALDATCTKDIVESAVVDESGMQRT